MLATSKKSPLARGLRNNNWGNIRLSNINWQGEIKGADDEFEVFSSPEWGVRAMVRILKNDFKAGKTLAATINEYAPPHENATSAYVNHVVEDSGVPGDAVPDYNDEDTMALIVGAMVEHENGIKMNDYYWSKVYEGIRLERM
jgi:hypothetical protein